MSILATIKDHSGRIYRGIQFLLVLSIAATALGAAGLVRDSSFTSALIVSMVATGLALLVLMYMRSSVVQR
ncbi:MAG: GGDEF-domain containing protein, partial [Mesorhizobium sp.]